MKYFWSLPFYFKTSTHDCPFTKYHQIYSRQHASCYLNSSWNRIFLNKSHHSEGIYMLNSFVLPILRPHLPYRLCRRFLLIQRTCWKFSVNFDTAFWVLWQFRHDLQVSTQWLFSSWGKPKKGLQRCHSSVFISFSFAVICCTVMFSHHHLSALKCLQ